LAFEKKRNGKQKWKQERLKQKRGNAEKSGSLKKKRKEAMEFEKHKRREALEAEQLKKQKLACQIDRDKAEHERRGSSVAKGKLFGDAMRASAIRMGADPIDAIPFFATALFDHLEVPWLAFGFCVKRQRR